jgi:hypothetical protein
MSGIYNKLSPYYTTPDSAGYLDIINFRNIPSETDDILFEVTKNYENRPDLLSYDLYGDVNLWWVFAVRNKSIIKDPVFDLVAGIKIYLPKLSTIKTSLGI